MSLKVEEEEEERGYLILQGVILIQFDPSFDLRGAFRGAGFSFIFSWLMFIVVVLFLVGGNFYTLGCKPWDNGELLEVETDTY